MSPLLRARLAPFQNRDFRNFFLVQTLSLVGTWSHDLARSWIIIAATGSAGALGNLNLAIAVPCLFLILQGGVLVDRADVRRLMQWTKSLLGISALILALLTEFGSLQVWHLLVFGIIEGVIVAFDSPAFQALTVRLVPRGEFQQAIALNSTNFHTSRMIGPMVAAWLMAWHGPSLVFFFDAFTYLAVAIVISRVNLNSTIVRQATADMKAPLKAGLRYIYENKILRYRVFQLMLTLAMVYPLMISVFRVFVKEKFNLDESEFGHVFSVTALGSMGGALTFAILQPTKPIRALWFGIPLVFMMLLISPWLPSLPVTVLAMALTGYGLYLTFASLTVTMHLQVEESYRGRMSSVIGMGFSSIGPLMSFPWGHIADAVGSERAIWLSAGLFGLGSAYLALANRKAEAALSPKPVIDGTT